LRGKEEVKVKETALHYTTKVRLGSKLEQKKGVSGTKGDDYGKGKWARTDTPTMNPPRKKKEKKNAQPKECTKWEPK